MLSVVARPAAQLKRPAADFGFAAFQFCINEFGKMLSYFYVIV